MISREYTIQGKVERRETRSSKDDEERKFEMWLRADQRRRRVSDDDNRDSNKCNWEENRGSAARGICYNWVQDPENRFPPINYQDLIMASALKKNKKDQEKVAEVDELVEQLGKLQMQRERGELCDGENTDEIERLLNKLQGLRVSANLDKK